MKEEHKPFDLGQIVEVRLSIYTTEDFASPLLKEVHYF